MRMRLRKKLFIAMIVSMNLFAAVPAGASANLQLDIDNTIKLPATIHFPPYALLSRPLIKWSIDLTGAYFSPILTGEDGTVYFTGSTAEKGNGLYAVNYNGNYKWVARSQDKGLEPQDLAIGQDGTLYTGSLSELAVYTAEGKLKWKMDDFEGTDPAKYRSAPVIGADGTIFLSAGPVLAYYPDGSLKWSLKLSSTGKHTLYLGPDGTLYVQGSNELYAISPAGTLKWTVPMASMYGLAIGPDGTIYMGVNMSGQLMAIGPDGKVKWSYKASIGSKPDVGADGTIYFISKNNVVALHPDGTIYWESPFKEGPISVTAGPDGQVYVQTILSEGVSHLHKVTASDGGVAWTSGTLKGLVFRDPAFGSDGSVYVITSKSVYSLGAGNPVTSVALDHTQLTLAEGQSQPLKAAISPDNAGNKKVFWSSSNEEVADVDGNGIVTAGKSGQARILAKTEDGEYTSVCTVTVTKPDPPMNAADPFSDIAKHWAKEDILRAYGQKVASGYPDFTFRPDAAVTRSEFAVMLVNGLQPAVAGAALDFADADSIEDWAASSVAKAKQLGIISGYPDGTFGAANPITHAEMIAMVIRASRLAANLAGEASTGYADDADIPEWARSAAALSYKHALLGGLQSNQFKPSAQATRAEAVAAIVRMLAIQAKN